MVYRVGVLLFAGLFANSLVAQTYSFGRGTKAEVTTKLLRSNSGVDTMEVTLTVPTVEMDRQNDGFDKVQVKGLYPIDQAGKPELPTTGVLFAVPAGFEPRLSIVNKQDRVFQDVTVRPTQKRFRCGPKEDSGFSFDAALYGSQDVFPRNAIEMETVGQMRDLKLMRVAFNPLQLDFAKKTLHVTTETTIKVEFQRTQEKAAPIRLPKTFYQIAKGVAANSASLDSSRLVEESEKLLIVVADSYTNAIQPLVAWKKQRGMTVEVVTATAAGATKDKIKTYIQNYYNSVSGKPTHLLFVGNKTTMPGHSESTGSGSAATDYTYSLLSGTDAIPDVTYGRILADNVDEVNTQVTRMIQYESTPEMGGTWYHKATTIASNEGEDPSDQEYAEQVAEALKAGTYTDVDGFFQGEKTATAKNITEALVQGRSWLSYFGHGSGTSWGSTNDTFNVSTVSKLTNDHRLPIIIDVACMNAAWASITKCFGKAWVTQKNGANHAGAVGYYGGSVNISWHPPAIMSLGAAKYHFEKSIESLGGTVLAGQLYLVEKSGTGEEVTDNLKWYNLFGDPSMVLRTAPPVL